jgi:hypothetical protein
MRLAIAGRFEEAHIFLFAAAAPILMHLRLSRVDALLSRAGRRHAPSRDSIARTVGRIESVLRSGSPFISQGCVTRALTFYYFLRRNGVDVSLVFGAGEVDKKFAAHCWIERENQPYLEKVNPRDFFAEIYRFRKYE